MDVITLRLSVTNDYLIPMGRGFLIVDTGFKVDWDLFRRRLGEVGIEISDLAALLLTHHNDDHSGLVNRLVEANPRIRIVMSELAKPLLERGEDDFGHGRHAVNRRVALLLTLPVKAFKVWLSTGRWVDRHHQLMFPPYFGRASDILIGGETRLRDLGLDLDGKIILTPGHTVDSISLVLDDGDAFVGDAAANMLQWAGTHYRVIALDDADEYDRSWRKLIDAGARRIFPAHGEPFPAERLNENLGRH
jgi:glyoxylase-like metal-dependent hydrolase (beta-lactamase superfamily II)